MPPARRILIVDDDPYTRDLVGTALRGQGHEVVGAPRYAQGLEAARAQRPHLILLDVVLPDGSGVDLARTLRLESPAAEMPLIVLMSAFSKGRLADQRRMKEEAGAVAFLTKPLALPAIIDLVEQVLAGRSAPAAPAEAAAWPTAADRPGVMASGPDSRSASAAPRPAARGPAPRTPAPAAGGDAPAAPQPVPVLADPGRSLLAALAQAWRRGWTGTLNVSRPSADRTIVLERGQVVWATTSLAEQRLGEDALVQQMEGIVLGALAWPEGSYRVVPAATGPATADRVAVSPVPRLVARAFREVVSADRLDARLAAIGDHLIVRRADVPGAAIAQLAPTLEESALLEALAEPGPLEQVLSAYPGGPDVAAPYVAALLALGIVAPVEARGRAGEEEPGGRARAAAVPGEASAPARVGGRAQAAAKHGSDHHAAQEAARRLLEAEAAFEEGRGAVDRGDLAAAAEALARATALCPDEGEYRAWSAWVRALSAHAAFDRTLDEITAEMERAAGLTPSSEGVYELIERVSRLRR